MKLKDLAALDTADLTTAFNPLKRPDVRKVYGYW
jgi:hypothetical protein